MDNHIEVNLDGLAYRLVDLMVNSYSPKYGMGSMSSTVYDTAWVSMISKSVKGSPQWLFPESFHYILNHQEPSGGWSTNGAAIDRILCCSAAVLALHRHRQTPLQLSSLNLVINIDERIIRATTYLQQELETWDVKSTDRVGFELLVPSILAQLESFGTKFQFKDRDRLLKIRSQKLTRFDFTMLYEARISTALHSLEAFDGSKDLDFDRVAQHKVCGGSMMASPSSTAAYLMNSSKWDIEAEAYLRNVIENGHGRGNGSVPSAFPSTIFEFTWILGNLLQGGFNKIALGAQQLQVAKDLLKSQFKTGSGVIGFAPDLEPDADDTSMGIIVLSLLGESNSLSPLIDKFEDCQCFKTYTTERNPSFSANCNVLDALLNAPFPRTHLGQIEKVVRFLCRIWWDSRGKIADKWSISDYYPTMLMAKSLVKVMNAWNQGKLPGLPETLMKEDVTISLIQCFIRTAEAQNNDGSWGELHSPEETAYAVLTIKHLDFISLAPIFNTQMSLALERARNFLFSKVETHQVPEALWVEKVLYGSTPISQSYILAALKSSSVVHSSSLESLLWMDQVTKPYYFYKQLPMFSGTPEWRLKAALIESSLFKTRLKNAAAGIFPRKNMREEKYLDFIPFTWVGGANRKAMDVVFSTTVCETMMVMSALIYQVDEFMENVVGSLQEQHFNQVKGVIRSIFAQVKKHSDSLEEFLNDPLVSQNGSSSVDDVRNILSRFVHHTIYHTQISQASSYDLERLHFSLEEFLLSHLRQTADNRHMSKGEPMISKTRSFFSWVRTISANHTGGPFAFSFLLCLLSEGEDTFTTTREKYIAEDVSRHLATLCRIYNDFGSVVRDRAEFNLNSINFPEFNGQNAAASDTVLKQQLMEVAEYERMCLDIALAKLRDVTDERNWRVVKAFCDVTNVYGEMYTVKDLTPTLKRVVLGESIVKKKTLPKSGMNGVHL